MPAGFVEHLDRGQGCSNGSGINKYISFFFNVRIRMLEETCTQCSTFSTQAILDKWPLQEFWGWKLFYSGKLYGTLCFKKIKLRLLLFLFERVGYIIILYGNPKRLSSFSKVIIFGIVLCSHFRISASVLANYYRKSGSTAFWQLLKENEIKKYWSSCFQKVNHADYFMWTCSCSSLCLPIFTKKKGTWCDKYFSVPSQ